MAMSPRTHDDQNSRNISGLKRDGECSGGAHGDFFKLCVLELGGLSTRIVAFKDPRNLQGFCGN